MADETTGRPSLGPTPGDTDFVLTLAALQGYGSSNYGPTEAEKEMLRRIRTSSTSPRLDQLIDNLLNTHPPLSERGASKPTGPKSPTPSAAKRKAKR